MSPSKNTKEQIEFVRQQLISCEITRDSLPYHKKFGELYTQYSQSGLPVLSKNDYWRLISATGKKGNAKQKNIIKFPSIAVTTEESLEILRLLPDDAGSRDRLPYTTEFDYIYKIFKKHTQRKLSKNEFWRLLIRVAKKSRKPKPIDINPSNTLSKNLLTDLYRMNPWWKQNLPKKIPESKRQVYQVLFDNLLNGHCPIVVLRGPRQVGKTTIQLQIIRDLLEQYSIPPEQILRVQFDRLKSLVLDDPIVTIVDWFETEIIKDTFNNLAHQEKEIYIFLDEIQDVDNWSSQLKHIVDHESCHVFITGSSAIRIFEGKESLAGRAYWNEINTLGLSEICQFRKMGTLEPYISEVDVSRFRDKEFWIDFKKWSPDKQLLDDVYQKFCDFGGYPFCHINEKISWQKVNKYLFETVVARTIDHDLKVNFNSEYKDKIATLNSTILRKTFRTLCKYTGMTIGTNKLHAEFYSELSESLTDRQIQLILDFFENSMLIKVIRSLGHHLKRAKSEKKFCLCDHAIRKALLNEEVDLYGRDINSDTAGHIVEGIVGTFLASIDDAGVSYLPDGNDRMKEGREIDYIFEVGSAHIPIEIKYSEHPKINKGIETFLQNPANNAPFGLVVTKNEVPLNYFKNENIIPISVKKLLLLK
ncbi:MAG: AAA family ATPase [Planctomycetaceae bacterium]|jgi:predicted AAA+ superfamily ATPase|nr:AAA family ATPase [Planctomycetaceae bacterium]